MFVLVICDLSPSPLRKGLVKSVRAKDFFSAYAEVPKMAYLNTRMRGSQRKLRQVD